MGDDDHKLNGIFYAINGSTGEMKPLGKTAIEIPELSPGGIIPKEVIFEEAIDQKKMEIMIVPKTITKKRFVKLLMGMGYQRNKANKMHGEYMNLNKIRTKIGMLFFEMFYEKE